MFKFQTIKNKTFVMLYLELRISVHLAWEQICPQGKYFYYKRYERLQELFLRGFHQALDFSNWREWGGTPHSFKIVIAHLKWPQLC